MLRSTRCLCCEQLVHAVKTLQLMQAVLHGCVRYTSMEARAKVAVNVNGNMNSIRMLMPRSAALVHFRNAGSAFLSRSNVQPPRMYNEAHGYICSKTAPAAQSL